MPEDTAEQEKDLSAAFGLNDIQSEPALASIRTQSGNEHVSAERTYAIADGIGFVEGASIRDAFHYSRPREKFIATEIKSYGKFGGPAAYFGTGQLQGETIEGLMKNPALAKHIVTISGNFLVVHHRSLGAIEALLDRHQGRPVSRLRDANPVPNIIDEIGDSAIQGKRIDGVIVLLGKSSEIVVKAGSVERCVEITERIENKTS